MKQLTISIPDKKYLFFMELLKNLGFAKVTEIDIPEEHKTAVRERMKKSSEDPERILDWESVQDHFQLDS